MLFICRVSFGDGNKGSRRLSGHFLNGLHNGSKTKFPLCSPSESCMIFPLQWATGQYLLRLLTLFYLFFSPFIIILPSLFNLTFYLVSSFSLHTSSLTISSPPLPHDISRYFPLGRGGIILSVQPGTYSREKQHFAKHPLFSLNVWMVANQFFMLFIPSYLSSIHIIRVYKKKFIIWHQWFFHQNLTNVTFVLTEYFASSSKFFKQNL